MARKKCVDTWNRQVAYLMKQYLALMTGGRDPRLSDAHLDNDHANYFDPELNALKHARQSMTTMQAEYACVEAAAFARQSSASLYCSPGRFNASATVEWLQCHYEQQDGISLPRGAMFGHYLDYCQQVALEPINQATFGKIIRAVFPEVKTRRLGTRGQSKYHYYGLTIKETSPYKDIMLNAQRVNNYFGESPKGGHSRTVAQCSLLHTPVTGGETVQGSVLLQDFPSMANISIPADIKEKTAVFLMMYRHHSQRVVDAILRANFAEVKEFILHFWQSLPNHIHVILSDTKVIHTVALCDTVLYSAVSQLLIPGILQPLPASLMMAMRTFGRDLITWLTEALKSHPAKLRNKKLQVARRFSRCMWRQTAVSHMASVSRSFLHSCDLVRKLGHDWKLLDLEIITKESTRDLGLTSNDTKTLMLTRMHEFGRLLLQQTSLDRYMEWVKVVYSSSVKQELKSNTTADVQESARVVLLQWSYVSKVIIKELTLISADTFGPYHLMSLLFQDYVLHLAEEWQRLEAEQRLRTEVYGDKPKEIEPEWTKAAWSTPLPPSDQTMNDDLYQRGIGSIASLTSSYHVTPTQLPTNHPGERIPPSHTSFSPETRLKPTVRTVYEEFRVASSVTRIPEGSSRLDTCHVPHCQDEMVQQTRPFDGDADRTQSDDAASSVLDLSLNYNSSLTEDDALVDRVISKGYATMDDCSQCISPSGWNISPQMSPSPNSIHSKVLRDPVLARHSPANPDSQTRSVLTQQVLRDPVLARHSPANPDSQTRSVLTQQVLRDPFLPRHSPANPDSQTRSVLTQQVLRDPVLARHSPANPDSQTRSVLTQQALRDPVLARHSPANPDSQTRSVLPQQALRDPFMPRHSPANPDSQTRSVLTQQVLTSPVATGLPQPDQPLAAPTTQWNMAVRMFAPSQPRHFLSGPTIKGPNGDVDVQGWQGDRDSSGQTSRVFSTSTPSPELMSSQAHASILDRYTPLSYPSSQAVRTPDSPSDHHFSYHDNMTALVSRTSVAGYDGRVTNVTQFTGSLQVAPLFSPRKRWLLEETTGGTMVSSKRVTDP